MIDHLDHICQLAGNARHVGIGTDLDGGYGTEQTPADVNTIADLARLPDLLADRGYSVAGHRIDFARQLDSVSCWRVGENERISDRRSCQRGRWYAIANADEVDSPALLVYPPRIVENIRRMIAIAGGARQKAPSDSAACEDAQDVGGRAVAVGGRHSAVQMCDACRNGDDGRCRHRRMSCWPISRSDRRSPSLSHYRPGFRKHGWRRSSMMPRRRSGCRPRFNRPGGGSTCCSTSIWAWDGPAFAPGRRRSRCINIWRRCPACGLAVFMLMTGICIKPIRRRRRQACDAAMEPVDALRGELQRLGCDVYGIGRGRHADVSDSCGTRRSAIESRHLLAVGRRLFGGTTRSRFSVGGGALEPRGKQAAPDCICLDLGHKAVAADPKGLRVVWPDLPDAEVMVHSEEHLNVARRTSK